MTNDEFRKLSLTRGVYRLAECLYAMPKCVRECGMPFHDLVKLIYDYMTAEDADEEIGRSEWFCPECNKFCLEEDLDIRCVRQGGPFSGPLDGATPPEYSDPECPYCHSDQVSEVFP